MELLKPAASPSSAWSAPHPAAVCSRRRAPSVLRVLPHGPATRTGTALRLLAPAGRAHGTTSSSSKPSRCSAAMGMESSAPNRSLAARLEVRLRPVPYPAAADTRSPRLLHLRALHGSEYLAAVDARLPALEAYRGHPRRRPLRVVPCSEYAAAEEERIPALVTCRSGPHLTSLRALAGSSVPARTRSRASLIRACCTAEDGASTAKKVKQSKKAKAEHILVFAVVCMVTYAEAQDIFALISQKLKIPGKITAALVFMFMAVKAVYTALKATKDIEEVLDYFRTMATKDGAAKV